MRKTWLAGGKSSPRAPPAGTNRSKTYRLRAVDLLAVDRRRAGALRAVDLRAVDFRAVDRRRAGALRAVDLRAVDFRAVDRRRAGALRAVDLRAVDLRAVDLRAVDLRAVDFRAGALFAVDFRAVVRLVDFRAGALLAVDFLAVDFRAALLAVGIGIALPGLRIDVKRRSGSKTNAFGLCVQRSCSCLWSVTGASIDGSFSVTDDERTRPDHRCNELRLVHTTSCHREVVHNERGFATLGQVFRSTDDTQRACGANKFDRKLSARARTHSR